MWALRLRRSLSAVPLKQELLSQPCRCWCIWMQRGWHGVGCPWSKKFIEWDRAERPAIQTDRTKKGQSFLWGKVSLWSLIQDLILSLAVSRVRIQEVGREYSISAHLLKMDTMWTFFFISNVRYDHFLVNSLSGAGSTHQSQSLS